MDNAKELDPESGDLWDDLRQHSRKMEIDRPYDVLIETHADMARESTAPDCETCARLAKLRGCDVKYIWISYGNQVVQISLEYCPKCGKKLE